MNNAHLYIWAVTLIIVLLVSLAGCVASITVPESGCLINGIDFNGRNDPFGIFCF